MKNLLKFIILFSIFLLSCFKSIKTDYIKDTSTDRSNYLTIWAHSDIQPRNENEKNNYETALKDIKENFPNTDIAIFGGDIVQHSDFEEIFLWYNSQKQKIHIPEWLEIAGNHDWRAIDLYKKYIRNELNYKSQKGNIIFILMSNERYGRKTFISDATFNWWKSIVISNQDKIIITVTHGNLDGSGLISSNLDRLNIINSSRFIEVLKTYRVDIWISGHSHFPGWMPDMHNINSELRGICFIDTGSIRDEGITGLESRLLVFKSGSDIAVLYYRDHTDKKNISGEGYNINLSHPYRP